MTVGPHPGGRGPRRRWAGVVAGAVAAAAGTALGPAPAAAVDPLWTVTVDEQAEVVDAAPVVVTGRAEAPLGGALGLDPVRTVTVTLVPTADGVPDACRTDALTTAVAPDGRRYRAEVHPPCNGPYRVEVRATTRGGASSGAPATATVAVADPGPAPDVPTAAGTTNGVVLRWAAAPTPDAVGWRVTGGVAPVDFGAATTSATVPATPGDRTLTLVARRWGAEGPGGLEVASPGARTGPVAVASPAAAPPPPVAPPDLPPSSAPAPRATTPSGTDRPSTSPPSTRPGVSVPARTPPTGVPEGYREDLPYGVPDDAFVPGEAPAPASASAADGDQVGAARPPATNVVRTRERTAPGLVAPFALAVVLATLAVHITWYLRRTRADGPTRQGTAG